MKTTWKMKTTISLYDMLHFSQLQMIWIIFNDNRVVDVIVMETNVDCSLLRKFYI